MLSRLSGPITVDGVIDEPGWATLPPLPLKMLTPFVGRAPSERTEIRVGYDERYFYAAGAFFDREPEEIKATSYARDNASGSDDRFGLVLDTFNDNQNALIFITTPTGNRTDIEVLNDAVTIEGASPMNFDWNTPWETATRRTAEGWFAEMRIPLSSLRFQDDHGRVVMGMLAWRYVARKNELDVYPEIQPKWDQAHGKPSLGQDVVLDGLDRRNPLYVTPYLLGGLGRYRETDATGEAFRTVGQSTYSAGVDAKYSPRSNVTLDLTLHPDFAQVEADDEMVNLTRFSLYFVEKRLFFQERSGLFEFNTGDDSRLFYSRRIGLADDGSKVPIYGGLRLVARAGGLDIGALDMQSMKTAENPSENLGVVRVRSQVLNDYSFAGAMLTSRVQADGTSKLALGLDTVLRLFGDEYLTLTGVESLNTALAPATTREFLEASRARALWERRNDLGFSYAAGWTYSGTRYEPAVGYNNRPDVTKYEARVSEGWLSPMESSLLTHKLSLRASAFLRNEDQGIQSSLLGLEWLLLQKSGGTATFSANAYGEDLVEDFALAESVVVPAGFYRFYGPRLAYSTPSGNRLRADVTAEAGSFYDGWRASASIAPTWNVSSHVELSLSYAYDRLWFPSRDQQLDSHLAKLRANLQLDTKWSALMFVQYSVLSDALVANVRLRYNLKEGSDVYVVYDETLTPAGQKQQPQMPLSAARTLLVKLSYTFALL